MIKPEIIGQELKKLGFSFYVGVPCSYLKGFINYAMNKQEYISAVNEGDAAAIAAGAYLGGRKAVVIMQNSGLANAISPLTSLNDPFEIPLMGFIGLRGGADDEPQHKQMGQITADLLDLMGIKWEYLSKESEKAKKQLRRANAYIEQRKSFFFLVQKGTFEYEELRALPKDSEIHPIKRDRSNNDERPTRLNALTVINQLKNRDVAVIATTGKTGRELCDLEDAENNLYMVGSMGCAGSLGLGAALARPNKQFIVIDGDGALLMRLGSLATNGYYGPSNMLHILLDNEAYESTGGQSTHSGNVNFIDIAAGCGYSKALYAHNIEEFERAVQDWKKDQTLTFLYLRISTASVKALGRPKLKPYEVGRRFEVFLRD